MSSAIFTPRISSVLDVVKGFFVVMMLIEHTRSSFSIPLDSNKFPVLYKISQLACSLDMTVFSAAYGFASYVQYFQPGTRLQKCLKSVYLIFSALFISNVLFSAGPFREAPLIDRWIEFATFKTLYWDFLGIFIILLALGQLITRPLLNLQTTMPMKLAIYSFLLATPLIISMYPNKTCTTPLQIYTSHLLGCIERTTPGTQRYSAVSFFFFFNWGCILADIIKGPNSRKSVLLYISLWLIPASYYLQRLLQVRRSWEYLNYPPFRRFPMTPELSLAWFGLDLIALSLAYGLVLLRDLAPLLFTLPVNLIEHLGANVLLYFFMNNLFINGLFGSHQWRQKYKKTNQEWEYWVLVFAILSILATKLVLVLAKQSRK